MRGKADRQGKMFFAIDLEERVRALNIAAAVSVERALTGAPGL